MDRGSKVWVMKSCIKFAQTFCPALRERFLPPAPSREEFLQAMRSRTNKQQIDRRLCEYPLLVAQLSDSMTALE
jgi:hypothetical protein